MTDGHRTILHVAVLMCAPMTRETPEMTERLENILKRVGSANIGSISASPSQPPPPPSDGSGWTTISPSPPPPPPPPPPPLPRSLHSLLNLWASWSFFSAVISSTRLTSPSVARVLIIFEELDFALWFLRLILIMLIWCKSLKCFSCDSFASSLMRYPSSSFLIFGSKILLSCSAYYVPSPLCLQVPFEIVLTNTACRIVLLWLQRQKIPTSCEFVFWRWSSFFVSSRQCIFYCAPYNLMLKSSLSSQFSGTFFGTKLQGFAGLLENIYFGIIISAFL